MASAAGSMLGKVAVITGSTSGIGRAMVQALAKEGACVTITGRSEKGLEEVSQECQNVGLTKDKILCVQGDISEDKTCEKLVNETIARFDKLDILVNNAGISFFSNLENTSMEKYDLLHRINCRSAVLMTKLALSHLVKTKGNIINISSIEGTLATPELFHYCMSKAALDHFTRCASLEFADHGIRMNSISPGFIQTPMFNRVGLAEETVEMIASNLSNLIPLKRIGIPEDVVNMALFLLSDKASYITGSSFTVDGGIRNVSVKLTPD